MLSLTTIRKKSISKTLPWISSIWKIMLYRIFIGANVHISLYFKKKNYIFLDHMQIYIEAVRLTNKYEVG